MFAGIAVRDYPVALAWYKRLFGRPPNVFPKADEAMWHLVDAGSVYVVADAARAGYALLTLNVDDLDATIAALAERGLATSAPETAPGLYRKVVLADPDGNTIALFEVPSASGG